MSCSVQQDHALLRLRLAPPFLVPEMISAVRRSLAREGGTAELLIVVHGSQNTPASEMRLMAERLGELRDAIGHRIAVAASSDLSYGLFRMFAVFAGAVDLDVAVFRGEPEAERWLRRAARDGTPPEIPGGAKGP